ncbi:hypothetical protein RJ641_033616 [Dillenia turbinata]|uniref:Uncharacterized protein n=1 Tax=Dillenia turbinata TaxID=194707 RepID=A0AAN8ZFY4_9MAGN
MDSLSKSPLFFIIVVFVLYCCLSTVISEYDSSAIRLPSDHNNGDLCSDLSTPSSCPVKCFRTDPVCGEDGVTYWCGCADAHCAGTRVVKLGFCEVGNGGTPLSGQALLLVHIVWLIVLGFSVLFGLF